MPVEAGERRGENFLNSPPKETNRIMQPAGLSFKGGINNPVPNALSLLQNQNLMFRYWVGANLWFDVGGFLKCLSH